MVREAQVHTLKPCLALIMTAALAGATVPALALTAWPEPEPAGGRQLLVPVRGCHHDVQTHYVPEVGRRMAHYHRGRDCRPYAAKQAPKKAVRRHCHRDFQRHYHDRYGKIWHRHEGPECRLIPYYEFSQPDYEGCLPFGLLMLCP
jgi:hypothetical protein